MNIKTFETYGKVDFLKKAVITLKDRFKINPYSEVILRANGLKGYVLKLNKSRFVLSVVGVVVCVVVPFITPLSVFVLLWGLK